MFAEFLKQNDLRALLSSAYRPYPPRQERAAWNAIAGARREALLRWGDEARRGYPMLTATQFLAFSRTGERLPYEQPYFRRRSLLIGAALAECLLDDGAHMDAVVDGVWCVCEETTWVISAHNGSDHPGALPMNERPLPDVENPYVDLFAAQTAATLADVLYLLEDKLDAVSPLIARRVRREIERRVLAPFMRHDDFWWMGMIRRDVNNWTPWIASNVIEAALLLERDPIRRAEIVARAMGMLDSYLAVLPADGGCDEGAGYFNVAGAALLDCLESVYLASGGRVSFYDEPFIRDIGAFPAKVHVGGEIFLNFADCDARPKLDGERLYRYGLRTGNARLMALGGEIHARDLSESESPSGNDRTQMNRVLFSLFADVPAQPAQPLPPFDALPELQVFLWRQKGLTLAIKGGHNGEGHNHNDVGNFVVYADGEPCVIDMGNWVYTAKTFGPQRYTLGNTRARNHNVPLIGGVEQAAGRERTARDVRADERGASMDIALAYPPEAGVESLVRQIAMVDGGIRLTDRVRLREARDVTWVFMLREKPDCAPGEARFGPMILRHDAGLAQAVEEMPVTDERMARCFPGSVWRLTLGAAASREHEQTIIITRS